MGYEKFCLLCGSPLNNIGIFDVKEKNKLRKYIENINENNGLLSLGDSFDIDSFIQVIKESDENYKNKFNFVNLGNDKKYFWLNDLLFLHKNGNNYKVISADTWDGSFKTDSGEFTLINNNKIKNDKFGKYNDGLVIHLDCYKYIEKKYCKNLNYSNINYGLVSGSNMYEFENIPWLEYFVSGNDYLLESPLKNKKHKKKLDGINFSRYFDCEKPKQTKVKKDIKRDIKRPSPSESATLFSVGDIKKGNDGNNWIIVKNKNGIKKWGKYK
jgi:hypothetical protein